MNQWRLSQNQQHQNVRDQGMKPLKGIMKIQMKRNQWSRKDLHYVFFLAQHLKISDQHQVDQHIESNWIEFIFLFHQPIQSPNFIYYPFINHFFGALWGTPFANWFGGWNQQFLNKGFKKKKSETFWNFRKIIKIQKEEMNH